MSDIFKAVQEIDEKGIDDKNDFLDKCIKELIEEDKKISDTLNPFKTSEQHETFSSDINKFNEDCIEFIEYIKQCSEESELSILYMLRQGNTIHYGKNNHGVRMDKSVIEMTNNQDLRKMYKLMQIEFASEFDENYKHTFGEGWSLCPIIGESVVIEIDSDNSMDKNWFYEQSHKEPGEKSPNKKII